MSKNLVFKLLYIWLTSNDYILQAVHTGRHDSDSENRE
jgi:hypothetical protein